MFFEVKNSYFTICLSPRNLNVQNSFENLEQYVLIETVKLFHFLFLLYQIEGIIFTRCFPIGTVRERLLDISEYVIKMIKAHFF